MNYLVRYEQSIWDVASATVGVQNAIFVAQLAQDWDDDLSNLWSTEITLPDVRVVTTSSIRGSVVLLPAESRLWKVRGNQSIYDLALQLHGAIDNTLQIAIDNNVSLDDTLTLGSFVEAFTIDVINKTLVTNTDLSGYVYATDVTEEGFLITELGEFIVTELGDRILV